MDEGWNSNKYWIIFNKKEITQYTKSYDIERYLKGYKIIGLLGWDDFIVEDKTKRHFTVPTIPISSKYLNEIDYKVITQVEEDPRYKGKIKWYIKPIVFGGNPNDSNNIKWISIEEHIQIVRWWNNTYLEIPR
jgi:hypothetical protein